MGLTISRRLNESVQCGDIIVSIAKIRGNRVSLKIDAPKCVRVLRSEIQDSEHKGDESGKEES